MSEDSNPSTAFIVDLDTETQDSPSSPVLGSASLARRGIGDAQLAKQPLSIEIFRALRVEDLPGLIGPLAAPLPLAEQRSTLSRVKFSHHQAARLLVRGLDAIEVALVTGYSPSTIRSLQSDPVFGELLAFYASQVEELHAESAAQLDSLGRDAMGELQARLEASPQAFSNRELMEVVELAMGSSPKGAKQGGAPSQSPVSVQVVFTERAGEAQAQAQAQAARNVAVDAEIIQ
jgi:hypothetical protein